MTESVVIRSMDLSGDGRWIKGVDSKSLVFAFWGNIQNTLSKENWSISIILNQFHIVKESNTKDQKQHLKD